MDTTKAIDDLKMPLTTSNKLSLAFVPTLLIGAVLFAFFINWERSNYSFDFFSVSKNSELLPLILFSLLLLFNIYHLTLFNKYSKLEPLYSNLDIKTKTKIINSLTGTFNWKSFETENPNYFNFFYTKYLFGIPFLANILIDEKGFYINVGHGEFKLPAIYFYKNFEKKIIKELNPRLESVNK